jgi:hypothetical protein
MELDSQQEIWKDVEATVRQLMLNAAVQQKVLTVPELFSELESLQRAQESLLARLTGRHALLQKGSGLKTSSRRRSFRKRS